MKISKEKHILLVHRASIQSNGSAGCTVEARKSTKSERAEPWREGLKFPEVTGVLLGPRDVFQNINKTKQPNQKRKKIQNDKTVKRNFNENNLEPLLQVRRMHDHRTNEDTGCQWWEALVLRFEVAKWDWVSRY